MASNWEPHGIILALLLVGVENAKVLIFANSPRENLDLQVSGGLPGGIFRAKNRYKKDMDAKSAQKAAPRPSKSLPERSWRASGAKKKPLVIYKSAQEEFWSEISKKSDPGAASGRHGSAVLAGPVKAYPGGFRPGTLSSNSSKHAHHRKRWSADSNRFATPGGHPGLQGSRASKIKASKASKN